MHIANISSKKMLLYFFAQKKMENFTDEMNNALLIYMLGKAIQKIDDENVKIEKLRQLLNDRVGKNELARNLLMCFVLHDTPENNAPLSAEESAEFERQYTQVDEMVESLSIDQSN